MSLSFCTFILSHLSGLKALHTQLSKTLLVGFFIMGKVLITKEEQDKFLFGTPVLAFLDILGFSDLVKHNAHSTVGHLYDTLVNNPVDLYNNFQSEESKSKVAELGENAQLSGLKIINVSDSIVMWTENSKQGSIVDLLYAVKLLMTVSMKLGVPLRGAVTMGDFHVFEKNGSVSIVGRPLVFAAEIEKIQKWSGCIVDKGIFTYLRSFEEVVMGRGNPPAIEKMTNLVVPYDSLPIDRPDKSGYAINWTMDKDITEETIRNSFSAYNKRTNTDTKIQESTDMKIKNTIDFFNHCRQKYRS